MRKESSDMNRSITLKDCVLPSEEFEKYLETYDRYGESLKKINRAHDDVLKAKKMLQEMDTFDKKLAEASDRRDKFKEVYKADIIKRDIEPELEKRIQRFSYFKGKLTDQEVYESERTKVIKEYDKLKKEYKERRNKELEPERKKCEENLEQLENDKLSYVQKRKNEICPGCDSIIEGKKKEIRDYLTCCTTIKNNPSSTRILSELDSSKIDSYVCSNSEEYLLDAVLRLEGTDQYPRKSYVNRNDVIARRKDCVKGSVLPFLGVVGVAIILFFIFGISPMQKIAPSGSSVAGVTQSILQFLLNVILALLGGGAFFAIVYGILEHFDLDTLGWIVGGCGGLYAAWDIFTDHHPTIPTSSMMGFGNITHGIITWILQIILCLLFLAILCAVILFTPLINIFYRPVKNEVVTGLETFESYFNSNKDLFFCLFNIDEAVGFACENRMTLELNNVIKSIANIENDRDYIQIEKKCKEQLKSLETTRNSELEEEYQSKQNILNKKESIRNELEAEENERIAKLQKSMDALDRAVDDIQEKIYMFLFENSGFLKPSGENNPQKLVKLIENLVIEKEYKEQALIHQSEDDWRYLKDATAKYLNESPDFNLVDSTRAVFASGANLSDFLYFIKPQADENGMAVLRKLQFKCNPIVGVYDYENLQGDNLSDELSHFIEWFCISVKRVTAQCILEKIAVVDLLSGNSNLKTEKFSGFLKVIDNEEGIHGLIQNLSVKENKIAERSKMVRNEAQDKKINLTEFGDVDSIYALNNAIMMVDEDEIKEDPDKPVEGDNGVWVKPVKYNIIIFVIPISAQKSMAKSILTDDLKKCFTSCVRSGIMPIFLVDSKSWKNPEQSEDVSWIKGLREKVVWRIYNIGKEKERRNSLDIQEQE